jgi:ABC-type lipoprotein release transport system permease subunit
MKNAFKALRNNKLKAGLIYLSLTVTLVSIFLITSISHGIISMYSNMLQNNGDIIITQARISDTFFSNVPLEDIQHIKNIEGIKSISALIVGASPVGDLPIVAVYGVSQNLMKNYKLLSGSYPKEGEVLIGKSIASALLKNATVTIADKKFHISGLFASDIGFESGGVVINLADAQSIFHKSSSMLLVNIDLKENIDTLIEQIRSHLKNVDVKSTQNFTRNYNQFKIINKSSLIISLLAFIMGLIAIASIMSVTVIQRRDEFGIMKALGISSSKIILSIVSEGLLLGVAAFFSALLLSEAALYIIKHIEMLHGYVNGVISFSLALAVFISTIMMSVLGSLIPAYTALKIDPMILIQRGN